jgi:hypothetical protein
LERFVFAAGAAVLCRITVKTRRAAFLHCRDTWVGHASAPRLPASPRFFLPSFQINMGLIFTILIINKTTIRT